MRLKSLKLIFDLADDGDGAVELPIDQATADAWDRHSGALPDRLIRRHISNGFGRAQVPS